MIPFSAVSPQKIKALEERLAALGIREKDLVEKFIRSGGKGGQNVNKTATCVYLKHGPSGLEVKCQQERTQSLNRFLARRILAERLEARLQGKKSQEQQRREKIRRQKRRRSRRAKEKMLQDKKRQSQKKQRRSSVKTED